MITKYVTIFIFNKTNDQILCRKLTTSIIKILRITLEIINFEHCCHLLLCHGSPWSYLAMKIAFTEHSGV
jgi:hypothetical protein